ncbi:hypothetical protein OAP66_03465 [Candidatus Pelagibacter sp.]|jgi:hypothetical protein|nr:hypothetical protein [Candidatus Pelagibacter sp.]
MFFIFLSFFISSIYFLLVGALSFKILFSENLKSKSNYYELALIGIISASLIPFLLNFFISLNLFLNNLLFILPFIAIFFLTKIRKELDFKKILIVSLIVSIISTFLISFDNVYRPDAGSYHLPFISILNNEKIIIGLSNLHFRFGHISIMQYLSASFNNHIFLDNGILIPLALIFSFFILYFVNLFFKEKNNLNFLIIFTILIFVIFRMNRYSSFGNDAPAHFYFLYLIVLTLNYKSYIGNYNTYFNKISLISIFIFFNKITMLIAFFIPFYFIFNKKFLDIYKSKVFIFILIIFFSWIGKNILISGCAAFPLEQTCFKNLEWFDKSETRRSNAISGRIENEAWTKGVTGQSEKNFEQYISSLDWINTWKKGHGVKILKKITPFILFMLFTTIYLLTIVERCKIKKLEKKNSFIFFLLLINLIGSLMWFLKFPVFRYGYGYLIGSFAILYSLILTNFIKIDEIKFKKTAKVIFCVLFVGILTKHSLRIYENASIKNSPWPNIYSDQNINTKYQLFSNFNNDQIVFYNPELSMCYYTDLTPCTHLTHEANIENIQLKLIYGYKKYSFTK